MVQARNSKVTYLIFIILFLNYGLLVLGKQIFTIQSASRDAHIGTSVVAGCD
jgi:hypothetical protein